VLAQKYMKANFTYETLDLKSKLTQRDKTIQELQLRILQYETAASQSKTEMIKRDEAVRKLAAKFEQSTKRLEELEQKLKERSQRMSFIDLKTSVASMK